jgi:type I protein arginine methyltransferase
MWRRRRRDAPDRKDKRDWSADMTRPASLIIDDATIKVLVDDRPATDSARLQATHGEYPTYDETLYSAMLADTARNAGFSSALAALAPGRRVLDIGTGPDLLWARESLRLGATHVVAVEVMDESFRRARANLQRWGLGADVTLLHGLSTKLTIEPKADLCVAEIIGSVAGAEGAAAVFADARERHMVDGGIVIPHRAETLVGGVCLQDALGGRAPAFTPDSVPLIERIFRCNGGPFDIRLRIQNVDASAVITSRAPVEINEFNGSLAAAQSRRVRLTVRAPGRLDGLLGWTKLWFIKGGEGLDTLDVATNWATIYFPLFDEPIAVEAGDAMDVTFAASVSDDGRHPDYRFEAVVSTRAGSFAAVHESEHHGSSFRACGLYERLFPM